MRPDDWLLLCRTVRFGETDAAGVLHFHQLLRWCHEAYEESLERFGLPAESIFPRPAFSGNAAAVGLPIVHCQADFRRPLVVGDPLRIELEPHAIEAEGFEVTYRFHRHDDLVARGLTRHLAIDPERRQRCALPEGIRRWLEASSLGRGIRPL